MKKLAIKPRTHKISLRKEWNYLWEARRQKHWPEVKIEIETWREEEQTARKQKTANGLRRMRSTVIGLCAKERQRAVAMGTLEMKTLAAKTAWGRFSHQERLWGHFHMPVFASVALAKWGRMRLEFGTLLIVFLSQCVGSVGNNKTILKIPFLGFLWKKNSSRARKQFLLKRTQNSA